MRRGVCFFREHEPKVAQVNFTNNTNPCGVLFLLIAIEFHESVRCAFCSSLSNFTNVRRGRVFLENTNRRSRKSISRISRIRAARCFVNCYRISRMCDEVPVNLPAWGRVRV